MPLKMEYQNKKCEDKSTWPSKSEKNLHYTIPSPEKRKFKQISLNHHSGQKKH